MSFGFRSRREEPTFEHFRLIADACGEVAFEFDPQADSFSWSRDPAEVFLGLEPGACSFRPDRPGPDVHPNDSDALRQGWSRAADGIPFSAEFRWRHKDGSWLWLNLTAIPLRNASSRGPKVLGLLRGTQALREYQEGQVEARRLETVGTMAGGIAHEFNNNLTPIRGYLELALDDLGPYHPLAEGLRIALDRVTYCADLVSQIQAYGRKSLLQCEAADVTRLISSAVRLAFSMNRERSEKIECEEILQAGMPLVWLDVAQFQQAVIQLVRNSLEAMPGGGRLTLRAEIVDIARRMNRGGQEIAPGRYLCLAVADTGEGVAPEHQSHVFDPFFTTRGRASARGMGLPMVQGMAAQHEGWVEMQSVVGKGTQVRVYLPVREDKTGLASVVKVDSDGTMPVLEAAPVGTLLVADDEPSIRSIIRRVFETEGWEVLEAADTESVLRAMRDYRYPIHLVVMDATLPGPPLEEVIARARQASRDLKILLTSGFERTDHMDRLIRNHGLSFLAKPFSTKELVARVDQLLAGTPGAEPK